MVRNKKLKRKAAPILKDKKKEVEPVEESGFEEEVNKCALQLQYS